MSIHIMFFLKYTLIFDLRTYIWDCRCMRIYMRARDPMTCETVVEQVSKIIETSGIENRVKHRRLIVSRSAISCVEELENRTRWKLVRGPRKVTDIPEFLKKWTHESSSH